MVILVKLACTGTMSFDAYLALIIISNIYDLMWESIPCLLLWNVYYFDRSAVSVTCIFLYELIKNTENYSPFSRLKTST